MNRKKLFVNLLFFVAFSSFGQEEKYIVGTDPTYPPFEFKNDNGEPSGFEVDVLKIIAREENFTIEIQYLKRENWQEALTKGKVDIFLGAFTISPEIMASAEMTLPIMQTQRVVYFLDTDNNQSLEMLTDLKGKTFTGNKGEGTTEQYAAQLSGNSQFYQPADTIFLALKSVWKGEADAAIGDDLVFQYYGQKYPQIAYRFIPFPNSERYIGYALKKGNISLKKKINNGLEKAQKQGEYQQLVQNYFGKI